MNNKDKDAKLVKVTVLQLCLVSFLFGVVVGILLHFFTGKHLYENI